jgi:hypothetical protein
MRPWQHARSSAGKNGNWKTELPVHEFIDSTKMACPDLRHRLVIHNKDPGLELTRRAFPDVDVRKVFLSHISEDLGCTPSLQEWLERCDISLFPEIPYRRRDLNFDEILERVMHAQGLQNVDPLHPVLDLLLLPTRFTDTAALPVLFNSFGPILIRRIIGGP